MFYFVKSFLAHHRDRLQSMRTIKVDCKRCGSPFSADPKNVKAVCPKCRFDDLGQGHKPK
jgi:predicted Zn-ribbon and HTH transcriptional regulator